MSEINQWQPMETAPADGTVLLMMARYIHATAEIPVIAHYSAEHGGWINQTFSSAVQLVVPSAWMFRPEPFGAVDRERCGYAATPAAQSAGQEPTSACSVCYGTGFDVNGKPCAFPHGPMRTTYSNAAPVNGGERELAIEEAAQIAETFKCGTCGMDGKCAAAIRELKGVRAADAPQVGGERLTRDEVHAKALAMPEPPVGVFAAGALTSPAKVGGDEREAFINKCIHLLESSRRAAEVVGIEHIEVFPYLPEYDEAVEWLKENRAALSADGGEDKRDAKYWRVLLANDWSLTSIECDVEPFRMWAIVGIAFSTGWHPTPREAINAAIAANQARKGE
ncbi:hypothetical protein PIN31115_02050 [Pandoraea iniqua]|uniref:Uncharacterized protein n=1 Tax=Pandoraea iniqua TaxID=2508288 RepID=A0A5E4UIR0_9BURK|nr:hypothetical protein [Pandoraea iniqua]VVD99927.1 hypothetical protein PIN31115_02050 [Pandoraea iniqua]